MRGDRVSGGMSGLLSGLFLVWRDSVEVAPAQRCLSLLPSWHPSACMPRRPLVCQLSLMGHDSTQGNRWWMKWDPNGSKEFIYLARVTILLLEDVDSLRRHYAKYPQDCALKIHMGPRVAS